MWGRDVDGEIPSRRTPLCTIFRARCHIQSRCRRVADSSSASVWVATNPSRWTSLAEFGLPSWNALSSPLIVTETHARPWISPRSTVRSMISFGKLVVGRYTYTRVLLNLLGISVRPHGEARARTDEESRQMMNSDHFYSTWTPTTADVKDRKRQARCYIHSCVYEIYWGINWGKGGLRFGACKVVSADKVMSGDSMYAVVSKAEHNLIKYKSCIVNLLYNKFDFWRYNLDMEALPDHCATF